MVDPRLREEVMALSPEEQRDLHAMLGATIAGEDEWDAATLRLLEESRRDADTGRAGTTPWHDVRADFVARGVWPPE